MEYCTFGKALQGCWFQGNLEWKKYYNVANYIDTQVNLVRLGDKPQTKFRELLYTHACLYNTHKTILKSLPENNYGNYYCYFLFNFGIPTPCMYMCV